MKLNKGIILSTFILIALSTFILIALVLVPLVSAADGDLTLTTTYDKNTPTFGDDNAKVSNPEHDDNNKEIVMVANTISIKNDGTGTTYKITDFDFNPDSTYDLVPGDITLEPQSVNQNIAPGATGGLVFKAKLPEDLDAVDTTVLPYEEVAFPVGTLTLTFENTTNYHILYFQDLFFFRFYQAVISQKQVMHWQLLSHIVLHRHKDLSQLQPKA